MRTVGHRGASALAPENTLRAFELAIKHQLDFAELDVHLSRDGHLVVTHDADLQRITGRSMPVAELTAVELAQADVGSHQGVPRLLDVIELARGRRDLCAPVLQAYRILARRSVAPGRLAGHDATHERARRGAAVLRAGR